MQFWLLDVSVRIKPVLLRTRWQYINQNILFVSFKTFNNIGRSFLATLQTFSDDRYTINQAHLNNDAVWVLIRNLVVPLGEAPIVH